jgi:hypothetical protein
MSDKKLKEKILVTLECRTNDKIMVTFKNEMEYDYVSIENLKNLSFKRDNDKIYNYVVNLIRFIGNLCLGHNIMAVEGFKKIYQLNTCMKIVTNSVLPEKLRASFAHLIHHMWFKSGEQTNFRKSQFFCKVWDDIERERTLVEDPEPALIELWQYIQSYLVDIQRTWELEMFIKKHFELLESLVKLTTDLLLENVLANHDIERLREILQKMLFINPKDEGTLKEFREELTACKTLLIDTFKVIQTFDFNNFVHGLLLQVKEGSTFNLKKQDRDSLQDEEVVDDSLQPALANRRDDDFNEISKVKDNTSSRTMLVKDRMIKGMSKK